MKSFKQHIHSIFWVIAIAAVFSLVACTKQLDQTPQTNISDASFWNTPTDLSLACNYLYSYLPGLGGNDPSGIPAPYQDNYSEVGWGGAANSTSDGSRIAPASSNVWTGYYKLIRAANNIIQHAKGVKGDTVLIHKYVGEARFFRALGYFELVKRFGDVPLITVTLNLNDTSLFAHRTSRQQVLDTVYADLDYASNYCPQPDKQVATEYGRISATAALAFKSRIGLFEGTWDKFHNEGNAAKHLQIAIDASNAIIAGGKHSLYTGAGDSSYYYEFNYLNAATQMNYSYSTNKENILIRLYGQNQTNNISAHTFDRAGGTDGGVTATKAFVDAYLFKDGLPVGVSPYDSTSNQTSTLTIFRNRDPRFGMSFFNKTQTSMSISGVIQYKPGLSYNIRKYYTPLDWLPSTSFVNFNIIRYSEVLLNNAEAKFELNGSVSDADLNATINVIRNRASNNTPSRLPLLSNAFISSNGLDMRTEIRRERSVELAFEGFYYWDILRWKKAETVLPSMMLGQKYFPAEMTSVSGVQFTPDGFIILEQSSKRSFDPKRDYLWPLPTQELALNANLTQNPNW
jgi:hypothetical protein